MKSPSELSLKLARQWRQAELRLTRLKQASQWPLKINIGKPSAKQILNNTVLVKAHLGQWRNNVIGQVEWCDESYQAVAKPINVPSHWVFESAAEWVQACADKAIQQHYHFLMAVLDQVDDSVYSVLIKHPSLWKKCSVEQTVQCYQLAQQLEPDCAKGQPLRALCINHNDSKFIEKNRALIQQLLAVRFPHAFDNLSLEAFLGAALHKNHWLLIVPLADGLLPFKQQRISSSELAQTHLPCSHLVVVENEQCVYQLPKLENTIAILGAGLDLAWLSNINFNKKQIAYWGDMDTWGLKMLGIARQQQPHLTALMMNQTLFESHQHKAVLEPQTVNAKKVEGLTADECVFYEYLRFLDLGRVEQEFIAEDLVINTLLNWY